MEHNYLGFNMSVGQAKPENIIHKEAACPFCDVKNLKNIIETKGDIILLENKYQVLEESHQLLIIESSRCSDDIPDYTPEHMHTLIRFAVSHWLKLIHSRHYKSVLMFKNHGPFSGGTMRHPHMQIIGIKKLEFKNMYDKIYFDGFPVTEKDGVEMNISTKPRVGFTEINLIMHDMSAIDTLADFIQISVDFIMHHFSANCNSYNLFFYMIDGSICVKIMPRFATSPLFIGYDIKLIPNNIKSLVKRFKSLYRIDEKTLSDEEKGNEK